MAVKLYNILCTESRKCEQSCISDWGLEGILLSIIGYCPNSISVLH